MPKYQIRQLDSAKRAREKQASRDQDRVRLERGDISPEALNRENGFFSALPLHKFRIAAIGGVPIEKLKKQ
jgi:hypothetical protein